MIKETMTREQRLMTAINLGVPDRVPVAPVVNLFACRQKNAKLVPPSGSGSDSRYYDEISKALHDTFDDLGGYDAQNFAYFSMPASSWRVNHPMILNVMPGTEDIPEDATLQCLERETMAVEDYDKIIARGWNSFCQEYFPREMGVSIEQIDANQKKLFQSYMTNVEYWKSRGVPVIVGGCCVAVEMILSLGRTLTNFAMDMHRYPDKVGAAMEAMLPDLIQNTIDDCTATGIPIVHLVSERGSAAYWNLDIFERYIFPPLKKMVEAFVDAGYICELHLDTDWTRNLPYFTELPKGKCFAQLDSITDIFKAKEILKGHMCLWGDVPASLLTLGTPDEVTAYCRKLIDVVGKDGGFILSTGCECPIDAKFENVKAMVDAPKYYNPHV